LALADRSIAVTHYPEIGQALARGNDYDLVCHGHSHERMIQQEGNTLRINPGEVMGRFGLSTYALYDTVGGQGEIIQV
jgi:predicted phosphodiesterase